MVSSGIIINRWRNTMKFYLIISLLIISLGVMAREENPAKFCNQNPECTQKMIEISNDYQNGNKLFSKEILDGFSGECFHLSSLYESKHAHHGAFIFEQSGRDLMADGIFTFFYNEDPFIAMNSIELKDWFISQNSHMVKTIKKLNQIEMQFLGDTSDYHYWFRSHPKTGKLLVIGKQASSEYLGFVFCEMEHR